MADLGGLSHQPLPVADGPAPEPDRGVFETMLVAGGVPRELDAHLARLDASVRALYGAPPPPACRTLLIEHAEPLELGRMRITVTPGTGGTLAATVTTAAMDPALVFPSEPVTRLAAMTVEDWRGAHKWADRRLLEAAESRCAPDVPLLVDPAGLALEASRASLFAVRDGALVTPPLDGRILPGVTRARVVALAREAGIEVVERPLPLAELLAADEVFLTGGVRGIEPVGACVPSGSWPAGPLTLRLAAALADGWRYLPRRGADPDLR